MSSIGRNTITRQDKVAWFLLSEAMVKIGQALDSLDRAKLQPGRAASNNTYWYRLNLARQLIGDCMQDNGRVSYEYRHDNNAAR